MYAMDLKASKKRKRKTNTPEEPVPELSDEIVHDILVRLPVKTILQCKAVCKAWRAIISDPLFTRAHLRWSASRCEQNPCLIVSPHTLDRVIRGEDWPTTFSNHIRFYQWQQDASMATLVHEKDFGNEFRSVRFFAHCDGLVLAPTDTRLYLFNPATRENLTLPESNREYLGPGVEPRCCCAGLGLDPRTGMYKVVRAFYRSMDPDTTMGRNMGMEVFTISGDGSDAWREIMDDLPYPVANWRTGVTVNGFLFWRVSRHHREQQPPWGLLHLSLADETFGITRLPDSVDPVLPYTFAMDELHGELCISELNDEESVTIWTLSIQEDGGQGQYWEQRCVVRLCGPFHPVAFLPDDQIMLATSYTVGIYDMATAKLTTEYQMGRLKFQGRRARTWKNLFMFNIQRYTESLVRISA
ncbi:unnamed protein product [Urochloa decumbens]|uniref:F-box domain-containing protein n=1 Tax=Urochloa decumbens TaxID=240449 RepID=A0ABC9A599_9POAL